MQLDTTIVESVFKAIQPSGEMVSQTRFYLAVRTKQLVANFFDLPLRWTTRQEDVRAKVQSIFDRISSYSESADSRTFSKQMFLAWAEEQWAHTHLTHLKQATLAVAIAPALARGLESGLGPSEPASWPPAGQSHPFLLPVLCGLSLF